MKNKPFLSAKLLVFVKDIVKVVKQTKTDKELSEYYIVSCFDIQNPNFVEFNFFTNSHNFEKTTLYSIELEFFNIINKNYQSIFVWGKKIKGYGLINENGEFEVAETDYYEINNSIRTFLNHFGFRLKVISRIQH